MEGVKLETVSEEKDLGVIISEGLKWEKQCSAAVKKAKKLLGMIKRNFVDRTKETTPLYAFIQKPGETSGRILLSDMKPILQ